MLPTAVRSYILHPYTACIDHRTGTKTADVAAVLDGDLEPLIKASLACGITTSHHRRSK